MTEPSGAPVGPSEAPHGGGPNPYPPGGYGAPPQPYPGFMPPPRHRNGLGTASLTVGVVALMAVLTVFGGPILGIAAVIMGLVARRRVKRGEAANGGGAMVGIVLGIIAIVLGGFVIWLGFGTEAFNEDYQNCVGHHPNSEQSCDQYRHAW